MPRKKKITELKNEEDEEKKEIKKKPRKSKKPQGAEHASEDIPEVLEAPKKKGRKKAEKKEEGNPKPKKPRKTAGRSGGGKRQPAIFSDDNVFAEPESQPKLKLATPLFPESTPIPNFFSGASDNNPPFGQPSLFNQSSQSLFGAAIPLPAPPLASAAPFQNPSNLFGSTNLLSGNLIESGLFGSSENLSPMKADASVLANQLENQNLFASLENIFYQHKDEDNSINKSPDPEKSKKKKTHTKVAKKINWAVPKKFQQAKKAKSGKKKGKRDESDDDFVISDEQEEMKDVVDESKKSSHKAQEESEPECKLSESEKEESHEEEKSEREYPDNLKESEEELSELEEEMERGFEEADQEEKAKQINKENAKVDGKVPNAEQFTIYKEDDKYYTAALMFTDLDLNINKFYMIQLLEDIFDPSYFMLFIRYGRVGAEGKILQRYFDDVDKAVDAYEEKFNSKIDRGYTEIEIDYSENAEKKPAHYLPDFDSNLDGRLQDLIKLIFNMDKMKNQLQSRHVDMKKLPLGKLSKATLARGYLILKEIEDVINGRSKGNLKEMSSDFYTIIPHNFGSKPISQFVINTNARVQELMELMQSLSDMNIASQLSQFRGTENCASLDSNYLKLRCEIAPLEPEADEFKLVENYFMNSKMDLSIKMHEVFKLKREKEEVKFKSFIGNPTLLWHGSRVSNFAGILSQGLRIAPKEAPITGFTYGKGIYFSDMVVKAAEFCHPEPSESVGILLLCRVALGNPRKLYEPNQDAADLPPGYHSVHAVGKTSPHPSYSTIHNNMLVPCGEPVSNPDIGASTQYNEYVVFNESQIKLEYLVLCQFG